MEPAIKGPGGSEVDFQFFVASYSFIEENGSYQECNCMYFRDFKIRSLNNIFSYRKKSSW